MLKIIDYRVVFINFKDIFSDIFTSLELNLRNVRLPAIVQGRRYMHNVRGELSQTLEDVMNIRCDVHNI